MSRYFLSLGLLVSFAVAAPGAYAGTPFPFTHVLNEPVWAEVVCLDPTRPILVTTRRLLSPDVAPASAASFRLHVRELKALQSMPRDSRFRRSFFSRDLERQLDATCVIDLEASQLASVSAYVPEPPPSRSTRLVPRE